MTESKRPRHGSSAQRPARISLGNVLLGLAMLLLLLCAYEVGTGRYHATSVLSGSMRPGLQPGDIVITQRVPIADLHVRDVVVFHPPNSTHKQLVHRIVKLTVKNGVTSITTRGDANNANDPTISSLSGTTAYRVVRVIPLLGYPAVWLQNSNHGIIVIILGVIVIGAAVVALFRKEAGGKATRPASRGNEGPSREDTPSEPAAASSARD